MRLADAISIVENTTRGPQLAPRRQDGTAPWERDGGTGMGGGSRPSEWDDEEIRDAGFDPETFGERPDFNVPPGWTVNAGNGALIPPGGGEVQGMDDQIMPGEFFEMNGQLYEWNGRSITEASQQEARGFVPEGQTRVGVRGRSTGTSGGGVGGGGGGSGDGVGWANLAQRQREFAYEQLLDRYDRVVAEQEAADRRQQSYIATMLEAAPMLAGGRDFYGGFGNYGGGTLLELMQGGRGVPLRTQIAPLPLPDNRGPDYGYIEQMLGGAV